MEQRLTPDFFYGSAIAALCGILMGLLLHGSWRKHPGGPRIWSGSPAAEALIQPGGGGVAQAGSAAGDPSAQPQAQTVADFHTGPYADTTADLDTGHVTPDPLPVTRLDPDRFGPKPAAAEPAQREDVADQVADVASAPASSLD